jgi:phage tail-like protein
MSAPLPKVYRFSRPEQWKGCLLHRCDVTKKGSLTPDRRLAARATPVGAFGPMSTVALAPEGTLYGRLVAPPGSGTPRLIRLDGSSGASRPFEIEGALASGQRWMVDREWIWTFAPKGSVVARYERDALQLDLELDVQLTIRDIAADGRQGIWLLIETAEGTIELLHIDCKGCRRKRCPVPCEASRPARLAAVLNGEQIVLLSSDGKRLIFLKAASCSVERVVSIGTLAACWSATELTSDARQRIGVWGPQTFEGQPARGIAFVLDGAGDTVDGPLTIPPAAALAVRRDVVWLTADSGLWRFGAADDQDARESDSTILTPALLSPDSDPTRGWLRAEVFVDLPRGAVLDAEFATTDKPDIAAQAIQIAGDRSTTAEQKQDAIWQLFTHPGARHFRFTAPVNADDQPIAIPLFESKDPWLWLRLKILTPPGTEPGPLKELRVLYPDLSIARNLPAAFRGERKDPTGSMRRLVGVLETTTQRLDDRIRGIGSYVDPATAPPGWFDYLGRWLDLPWDDELPDEVKQCLLANAGALLDARGTREGLRLLLRCLLGDRAAVRIVDLTVDYAATILGGRGTRGPALPALLGGSSWQTPTLSERAVVGRARLCQATDPFDVIAPAVHIEIRASAETKRSIEGLLRRILAQYLPAGVATKIRWPSAPDFASAMSDGDHVVLDGEGLGRLGRDSDLGRTVLAGRRGRLNDVGLGVDFRLR